MTKAKDARKAGEGRSGFFFKDDGSVEVHGMVEYPEPRLWKFVRWMRRCLAQGKKVPRGR